MKSKITVLVTCATGLGYPSAVKAIKMVKERKIRVIGTATEKHALGFFFVDKSYIVPQVKNKSFMKIMLNICRKEKVDIIFPAAPWELMKFAKNLKLFERNDTRVCVSSEETLKIALNKYLLFEECKKIGVPVPQYYLVKNLKEFRKAVFKLGYPRKEVCFKPIISAGSRGFRILSKEVDYSDLLLNQEGGSVYVTFEDVVSILKQKKSFPELLVMELLSKEEYSVDGLADNGKPLVILPRLREKITIGASVVGKAVYNKRIIELSKKIAQSLKLHCIFGLQFKLDQSGTPKLLEVNPRCHGALILSVASGANLFYLAIKLMLGERFKKPKIIWNTKMIRYFCEVYMNPQGTLYEI